tara:strand:+ start:2379 stop:3656 length:1278 start_codon:yes stop_codon:yes gene_type:complete
MTTPVNQGQYTFSGQLPSVTDATYGGDVSYNLADPYIRALTEFLFNQGYAFSSKPPPLEAITTQIAPFNPLEQAALDLTAQGVGAYAPYFQRGMEAYEGAFPFIGEGASVMRDAYPLYSEGIMGLRDAANLARSGLQPTERGYYEAINMLNAGLGSFDQRAANYYMNPYVNSVIENQLEDVDEFYDNKITELNLNAAGSGLRGSTRLGMIELEMEKQRQEARQQIINQGLTSAYSQAQNQFNIEQQALRGAAPTMAGLGQGFGNTRSGLAGLLAQLSTGISSGGQNFAQLGTGLAGFAPAMQSLGSGFIGAGGTLQGLQGADIAALANAGRTARGYEQSVYDTARQNAYNIYMDPYNRTSYQLGLAQGIPSNQMMMSQQQGAVASPMQTTLSGYAPYVNPYQILPNLPSLPGVGGIGFNQRAYGG